MPHEPFLLASIEVVPLCDGWAPLPLDDEAPGHAVDWDEQRSRFPWAFPPDDATSWAWHVHSFLIRHPDGPVLVDTGIGDLGRPPYDVAGRLEEELAAVHVSPESVRHVILTHLHGDHAGAASLPDGRPRFANARYHVHADDWAFFGTDRTPDDLTGRFAMAGLAEAGLIDLRDAIGQAQDAGEHRALWIDAADREGWAVCVGHFGRPFGHVAAAGWSPV